MKLTKEESDALERLNKRQNQRNLFTNITMKEIRAEVRRYKAKMSKIPHIGGSKANEKAILKWQRMSPQQRGKILMMPSVKRKKTMKAKFYAAIEIIKRKRR